MNNLFSNLPTDLKIYIIDFLIVTPHKFLDWIDEKKIDMSSKFFQENTKNLKFLLENKNLIRWEFLSANPYLIDYIHQNIDKINFYSYSRNKNASINLLKKNKNKLDWVEICKIPEFYDFILENSDHIKDSFFQNPKAISYIESFSKNNILTKNQIFYLNKNINAIDFLLDNPNHIDWIIISNLNSPDIIKIYNYNKNRIYWNNAFLNPYMIIIFNEKLDTIDYLEWYYISLNPKSYDFLMNHKDKIDNNSFLTNPSSIPYYKENKNKINYFFFSQNPNIYQIDKIQLKKLRDYYLNI